MCSLKKSTQWSIQSSAVCCLAHNRLPMDRPIRTILSLSLILILLFMWASSPMVTAKALLTELTLVGGGALTLAALLDLLMVTFGASGMDGAVRNQAAVTGTQPVPYIGQLLNRYLGTVLDGIAPATWAKPIQEGLSYLANGTLYLNAAATAPIADFQRWAWQEEGGNLVDYAPVVDSDTITVNGISIQVVELGEPLIVSGGVTYSSSIAYTWKESSSVTSSYGICGSANARFYVAGLHDGTSVARRFYVYPYNALSYRTLQTATNGYLSLGRSVYVTEPKWYSVWAVGNWSSMHTSLWPDSLGTVESLPSSMDGYYVGVQTIGDPNTFLGPMQQGQGTQLPFGDVVTVSSDTAARVHLFNYLRAAAAAYAGTGVADLPVTDVDTGEDQTLPLSVPLDTPIGVTGVSDGTIAGTGSQVGADAIAGDFTGTDAYTMDLTQFFPFCIPFDLFALYQKFEAEASAPVIDWPIPMPGGGDPLSVHLDFSVFDQLAVWVRRLELIAFAVGLMILTKNLIQGGD